MDPLSPDFLGRYWSQEEIAVNFVVFANLVGALLLGLLVGYERSYHGRAAGMRTYGLVCMASCAITVVVGYPGFWYGAGGAVAGASPIDVTRVIQGIVTGVGFLGAGVIMKEGLNISGLTTAASIWSSSAIGILVGIGFYAAAILLALLSAALMMWASRIEQWLPARPAVSLMLRFRSGFLADEAMLRAFALKRGYEIAGGTLHVQLAGGHQEWRFVAIAKGKRSGTQVSTLAKDLQELEGVEGFHVAHARN
jgi:putative Mg2+ transporter-C (MgtC) family protein